VAADRQRELKRACGARHRARQRARAAADAAYAAELKAKQRAWDKGKYARDPEAHRQRKLRYYRNLRENHPERYAAFLAKNARDRRNISDETRARQNAERVRKYWVKQCKIWMIWGLSLSK